MKLGGALIECLSNHRWSCDTSVKPLINRPVRDAVGVFSVEGILVGKSYSVILNGPDTIDHIQILGLVISISSLGDMK